MKSVLLIGYSASLLAAIICVLLAAIQKASREQKTILLVTVFIFISTLGYWFSIQSTNMQSRLIAQKLIYVGGSHLYFLMLVFFSQYCSIKLPRCLYWISIIFDTFIMLSVMFCEYHPYFYRSMEYVNRNGIPDLKKEYGFIHYLYVAGILLYSTGMFLVSIRHMMQKRGKQRNLANIGLLLVIACPTTLYLCEKLLDLDYYIVPFGLIVGEVIIIVLIYRLKIYDVNATATEYIFETIQDVIITTDKDMRYKGSNQKALELYPKLKSAVMNMDIRELGVDFDKLNREGQSEDIVVNERIYAPHVKPIKKKNQVAGYVIWLYDVTEMRQHTMLLENYQKDLEKEVLTKTIQLQGMQEHMLTGFANIMESRDGVTGGHAKRTGAYVNAIVEELLRKDLFDEEIDEYYALRMRQAAPLHDIGKIAIPDKVLNKEGIYTKEEYDVMKKHSAIGAEIVEKNFSQLEDQDFYHLIRDIAHYHHEKWNGKGYPQGLKEEEIPLCARIMAVADVFDALVSKRPYKEAFSLDKSYQIIQEERGTSFDPRIVDCFVEIRPAIEKILESFYHDEADELQNAKARG